MTGAATVRYIDALTPLVDPRDLHDAVTFAKRMRYAEGLGVAAAVRSAAELYGARGYRVVASRDRRVLAFRRWRIEAENVVRNLAGAYIEEVR